MDLVASLVAGALGGFARAAAGARGWAQGATRRGVPWPVAGMIAVAPQLVLDAGSLLVARAILLAMAPRSPVVPLLLVVLLVVWLLWRGWRLVETNPSEVFLAGREAPGAEGLRVALRRVSRAPWRLIPRLVVAAAVVQLVLTAAGDAGLLAFGAGFCISSSAVPTAAALVLRRDLRSERLYLLAPQPARVLLSLAGLVHFGFAFLVAAAAVLRQVSAR